MAKRMTQEFFAGNAEMVQTVLWEEHKADLAQVIFDFAVPLEGSRSFMDLVEERHGMNGRELVAKEAITAFTFAPVEKVRLVQTEDALQALDIEFDEFVGRTVPEILGFPSLLSRMVQEQPVAHGSEMCLYVGMFLEKGLLEDPMIAHLMDYDAFEEEYVTDTLMRMMVGDVLWLHFWIEKLEGAFAADTIWRVLTFTLSHSFINDRNTLTFSPFCLANCPKARWDWYVAGSDEAHPPVSGSASGGALDALLGNFEEIAPWGRYVCDVSVCLAHFVCCNRVSLGRQRIVAPGQIPADECVIFMKDVAQGEAVELDYGVQYMLPREQQIHKYEGTDIGRLLHAVMKQFDSRVRRAFQKFMLSRS
jgi:hypothetical protein